MVGNFFRIGSDLHTASGCNHGFGYLSIVLFLQSNDCPGGESQKPVDP
jgi:hypothetical protein